MCCAVNTMPPVFLSINQTTSRVTLSPRYELLVGKSRPANLALGTRLDKAFVAKQQSRELSRDDALRTTRLDALNLCLTVQ